MPGRDRGGRRPVFLEPKLADLHDPSLLPGCNEAAERILQAVRDAKRICIYGDYDVDGITGTAILYMALKLLGAEVSYYIPHRIDEGYGLNEEAIRAKAAEKIDLLVTVDCGVAAVEEAALARQLGLDLIVTDHHEFAPTLPDASAVVHPPFALRKLSLWRSQRLRRCLQTRLDALPESGWSAARWATG